MLSKVMVIVPDILIFKDNYKGLMADITVMSNQKDENMKLMAMSTI
jgi:hypothetical protein